MKFIRKNSLAETVDSVNEALFFGKKISERERKKQPGGWHPSQGVKGSYWGMIAPTGHDFETGIKLLQGKQLQQEQEHHIYSVKKQAGQ